MSIKVSIVEDDLDISEALKTILNGTLGFRCVSTHSSGDDASAGLPVDKVDVVLMDLSLPGMSGIECTRRLKERRPKLLVMILTVHEDAEKIFQSLEAGASGYILKKTPPAEILEAIQELVNGGSPMSPAIARKVVQAFDRTEPVVAEVERLSIAERAVLDLLLRGERYKAIAEALNISAHTVRNHIHRIYEKLHVRSRREAVEKVRGRRPWFALGRS